MNSSWAWCKKPSEAEVALQAACHVRRTMRRTAGREMSREMSERSGLVTVDANCPIESSLFLVLIRTAVNARSKSPLMRPVGAES
jgi:hypothetical protein